MAGILALDAGARRIGVALSQGQLAIPLDALDAGEEAAGAIVMLAADRSISTIYVGLPLTMAGELAASGMAALELARKIRDAGFVNVKLIDERLTTVSAARALRATGRNAKTSKALIDSSAATHILEFALRSEELSGGCGKDLEDFDD